MSNVLVISKTTIFISDLWKNNTIILNEIGVDFQCTLY